VSEPSAEYVKFYLGKARNALKEARAVAKIELSEAAGRAAYHCAFHAASAYIFDRTGKIAKTHRGVRSEFSRLAKDDPLIEPELSAFLARAYELKSVADYGVGSEVGVTMAEAADAITNAEHFLDRVASVLTAAS
jgi:uncharacterized protein (UPF0332 family)